MVKITSMQSRVLQFILQNLDAHGVPPTLREIAHHFGWRAVGSAQDVIAALRKKGLLEPVSPGRARQTLPTEVAYRLLGKTPRPTPPRSTASSRRRAALRGPGLPNESAQTLWHPTLWDGAEPFDEGGHERASATAGWGPLQGNSPSSLSLSAPPFAQERHDELLDAVAVPLLGRVRAGNPAEAIVQPDGFVTFPRHPSMRSRQNALFYAVEVEGFSMMGAGMLPGDLLLIETLPEAKSGDLVLAAVGPDQEVTVKRFAPKGSPLYRVALGRTSYGSQGRDIWPPALLIPENDDFDPLPFGLESSDRIVGLVRSLFRPEFR